MSGVEGRVAIVTGAARGIGAAVTAALARQGALVAAADVDKEVVATAAAHRADGRQVRAFLTDVSDPVAVDELVADVDRLLGGIGILVNVAGILRPGPVLATSDADWAAMFAVNTTGVFLTARAVATRMVARGGGSIVTVGSNAAGVPRTGMAAYAASKAAATVFTRCLGLELAAHGIRCNIVSPGSTDTAMQRALWTDEHGADRVIAGSLAEYRTGIPLGRIADPADIADAVSFLVSDQARHITMHDLYVDGGATLRG
ncbi:2,3-dihydro-2,3-dihydroxybenzoate dehydrogenase [Actinophytocola xinjiangensis]|uniref:2,3-dihydro-2,3-dihydroxybenzoate dehydrogenase n=1 Tax=Actinophytocola xinjiangensis TaxID=485602 RepID=A0A7Z1B042_9PSEU|nr:2,3-dihydro-2,3-dihydroxybenzoate dehydrogenase [Actinophytocola xinjiangensis]OLF14229.1 2,3-dihydro-2,3-dihydroxybenzoate dehydrogenase [Actinophytocola xinjiangensis]